MTVRAKFTCTGKKEWPGDADGPFVNVELSPISAMDGGPEENKIFGEYTPSGKIEMGLTGGGLRAAEQFEIGKEFYVDFIPCETA